MSRIKYPNNTQDTILEFDTREKHFILFLNNYSVFKKEPSEIRREFGKARNVPSVKAMEAWAIEMVATYSRQRSTDKDDRYRAQVIKMEGFGPEAHGDGDDEEEPNDNTMMIT